MLPQKIAVFVRLYTKHNVLCFIKIIIYVWGMKGNILTLNKMPNHPTMLKLCRIMSSNSKVYAIIH